MWRKFPAWFSHIIGISIYIYSRQIAWSLMAFLESLMYVSRELQSIKWRVYGEIHNWCNRIEFKFYHIRIAWASKIQEIPKKIYLMKTPLFLYPWITPIAFANWRQISSKIPINSTKNSFKNEIIQIFHKYFWILGKWQRKTINIQHIWNFYGQMF